MEYLIAAVAGVFFFGVLLTPIVLRTGAPLLLLFLGIGMLLGENGPGGMHFDNFRFVYDLGSIALAVILFAGGLETKMADLRRAWGPALSMATVGVCLTTGILGALVSALFGMPLMQALLLGAVVGSTDAAATFMLLQQRNINLVGRTKETILIESGLNDPFAIFLTLVFVGVVGFTTTGPGLPTIQLFASQLGLGALFGVMGGFGLSTLVNRVTLPDGMYPVLILTGGLSLFGVTAFLDGSGFLAVYLCGILVRARSTRSVARIVDFHGAMAWLSQIGLFLMLGLLVTPKDLPAVAGTGLAMAALLILVARPIATLVCLTPMGIPIRQQLFIGWVGLRGAVPIFLAIIPVISPGPITVTFFNEVFVIVIASLVVQGWTISIAAKVLKVEVPDQTNDT